MCGGGIRERLVVCAEESNGARHRVPDDACSSNRPKVQESCNAHECPKWQTSEWSGVSETNYFIFKRARFLFEFLIMEPKGGELSENIFGKNIIFG
jgi:hypothetical protein